MSSPIVEHPRFSIVIPAHNEEGNIGVTLAALAEAFASRHIEDYEIVVVNDNSSDGTVKEVAEASVKWPHIRCVHNTPPHGFGLAVKRGLEEFRGEAVCVVMADLSDAPADVLTYYDKIKQGAECVFGSRFIRGSRVVDYPWVKLIINRLANLFIKLLFRLDLNDITNAFKCYRREVIAGIQPLLSHHFNLTVEMPLKAIVRGYGYEVVPISWTNRKVGVSKLKIQEMGSRYLFIVLYALIEKLLSRGDYRRRR